MSSCDSSLAEPLKASFTASRSDKQSEQVAHTIAALRLQAHPEGGFFVETDRDPFEVPNPFATLSDIGSVDNATRNASTSIYYYLTPGSPQGNFHRNSGRTVHTLHKGRGRYVLIHADDLQPGGKARIETFVVGHDLANGERLQWIVEGGKYKASFLLPDVEGGQSSEGLLISETVIPGFDFRDHDFLQRRALSDLVTAEQATELDWLIREDGQ